jgi:WhiB family transcriptional regulator, redox-sensing transcriptional regulator
MNLDRSWRARAACAGMGADGVATFLPSHSGGRALSAQTRRTVEKAIKICDRCEVRTECLSFAVAAGEHSAVWGGRYISERDLPVLRRALAEDPESFAA